MMRRIILEASVRRSINKIPCRIMARKQMPSFLSSRKEFSISSQSNSSQKSASSEKQSSSGNHQSKLVLGSIVVGVAVAAAYQSGYIFHDKESHSSSKAIKFDHSEEKLKDILHLDDQVNSTNHKNMDLEDQVNTKNHKILDLEEPVNNTNDKNLDILNPDAEVPMKTEAAHSDVEHLNDPPVQREDESPAKGNLEMSPTKEVIPVKEKEISSLSSVPHNNEGSHYEASTEYSTLPKEKLEYDTMKSALSTDYDKGVGSTVLPKESVLENAPFLSQNSEEEAKDALGEKMGSSNSLSDAYLLRETNERSSEVPLNVNTSDGFKTSSEEKEDLVESDLLEEEKVILDLIEAIHVAERRQADLDARIFSEEKKKLKEKYQREVKDAQARELMYAEEAAILEKELDRERLKMEATIKSLKEKAEENLKRELQEKEEKAKMELTKVRELAKADLIAAIANEKSSHLEKMAEANVHIDALCMAFYARSEESRRSHSIHKLALGALALEDALSKGLPVQREIDALYAAFDGIDRESLLDLAFSSLPKETLSQGTDTLLRLKQKFDGLKGTLKHFSLIPAGGGGILAHSVAYVASSIKMRECGQSGDGIESVISNVESLLAEGKLAEAADALEGGVNGSQAEEIVLDWVRQARNRAIIEQALSLLQSYASSVSLT